jgi:hypothetical protein
MRNYITDGIYSIKSNQWNTLERMWMGLVHKLNREKMYRILVYLRVADIIQYTLQG